jgi:molybdate transport system permease protein
LKFAYQSSAPHLAVLGPSGSGKTATLRALAGLLGPGAGTVHFGDRPMDAVAVEDRQIGYVPQGYGLFPHLTVWQQLNFGVGADAGLAAHWLERLGLVGLEHRFADELSGGQRQRVSLAQALARSPDLVLLDEPFSALDSPVRLELRAELRRLQRETGISTVLVTHDPEEAAYLADEIVVLQEGRILQAGSTEEVFSHPASPDVARLLGIRNLSRGRVLQSGTVEVSGIRVSMETGDLSPGTELLWCIRPEEVRIGTDGDLRATVIDSVNLGVSRRVLVALGDELEVEAVSSGWADLVVGSSCTVTLPPTSIRLWPLHADAAAATGAAPST